MNNSIVRVSAFATLFLSAAVPAGMGGKLLPIPVAFSSPETGIGGGAKLRWLDPFDEPGMVDLMAYITQKAQTHAEAEVLRDSIAGAWRLDGYLETGKFPGRWFGAGNPPRDELASVYTPIYYGGWISAGRWLPDGWLVGAKATLENWDIRNDRQGIYATGARFTGDEGGLETNLGLEVSREGRDLPENPKSGAYLKMAALTSVPGTDFDWQDLTIDASYAVSFGEFTSVVRGHHEEAWGSIPFWRTPYMGWRKSLRGLPDKRLRGNVAQCLGTELRWNGPKVWIAQAQPAVFAELGRAEGHRAVWTADANWAAGAGARAVLAEGKAVLRVDYGWSEVGSGLYVDFGQAF